MQAAVRAVMPDFAHTREAVRRREQKARTLAAWCWDRGVTATDIIDSDAPTRRVVARAAGVHCPRTLETWSNVADLLSAKTDWAARHPGDPRAARAFLDQRPAWAGRTPSTVEATWPAHHS